MRCIESKSSHFAVRSLTVLAILSISVAAVAAPDIKPGAPAGTCCRVDGKEGSSHQRPDGTWSCKMDSIAFNRAFQAGLFPSGFDVRSLYQPAVTPVYPACPTGWILAAKAGGDTCTAPVSAPACPRGKVLTRDGDGLKDVCTEAVPLTRSPVPVAPVSSQ